MSFIITMVCDMSYIPPRQTQAVCSIPALPLIVTLWTSGRQRPTQVRDFAKRNKTTIAVQRIMASLSCLKNSDGKCSITFPV